MSGSIVVVAHPDDEALWLSAALAKAQRIVFCFGAPFGQAEAALARQAAVAGLGLPNLVNLAIPESGVRRLVNWKRPELGRTGMVIPDEAGRARYDANFATLLEALRPLLKGATDIHTHNGWGEYGHPEHVQIYRAVATLQQEFGFTIWSTNYVGPLSLGLARQIGALPYWQRKIVTPPDVALAKSLRNIYLRNGVWTWSRLHRWPRRETFYAQPAKPSRAWNSLFGEILLDCSALRYWRGPNAALRRL